MREIRPSGSEGGVAHLRHPYPYFSKNPSGTPLFSSDSDALALSRMSPLPLTFSQTCYVALVIQEPNV
jgi:hypothetical protein